MFDILDKQDHASVQAELVRAAQAGPEDDRLFLCRMNVSRNARRQMRFGDQKVGDLSCSCSNFMYNFNDRLYRYRIQFSLDDYDLMDVKYTEDQ